MPRIDLPDGQWADLLDLDQIRSGDLKAYRALMPVGGQLLMGDIDTMKDLLLTRLVTAWSLQLPIPKELPGTDDEPGALDRLPVPIYLALREAVDPYEDLFNGTGPDPKSSPASAGTSAASTSTSTTSS